MTAQAPLHLSVVGRLVIDHSPSGTSGTMVACLVAPNLVVTDGAPFRGLEAHPEVIVTTLWLPQEPGGLRRSWPATLVRYDPESDVAVLSFPGDESSSPATRPILADALPPSSVRGELHVPDDRSGPDSPSTYDTVVALEFDGARMIKADGRERLHIRAASEPPRLLAGAPVFWNDSVIAIISRAGQAPGDLYAIPATAIRRVMQNLTAPTPTLPEGFFSRLSESSHRALDHANGMRDAMHQDKVHMEHLLLALYEKDKGPTQRELERTGIREEELRRRLGEIAEADLPAFGSYRVTPLTTLPPVSPHAQQALIAAERSAVASGSAHIQSRHLLYGALSVRECRAISWMFERTPAVDPAQIDMTAAPSKRGDDAASTTGTAAADNDAGPAATDRGQQRARVAPDLPDGDDLLDVRREVRAICAVIAARETSPPLSIGLFGDWGTGKSFFMNRMEERITRLKETARSNPTSAYCRNIVQLRFNAWHYMDTDLWASLAAEIFEGLARALEEDEGLLEGVGGDANVARSRLLAATSHLRDVRAQAEQQKADADVALRDSQQRLTNLASEEREIIARLSPRELIKSAYRFVAGREKTAQSIDSAAQQLGIPEGKALATDTRATLLELEGLWGGVRAVLLSLRSGSAPLWIALVAIFVGVLGAIAVLTRYSDDLAPTVTAAAMLLGSAIGFVKKIIGPAREALATVEAARAESQTLIDGERTRRETELKRAHRAIQERSTAEETAITRVTQEIAQLEAQLEALRADRQMVDFVRAKQESTDYTKHFGVIARARNDFQQLTDLLRRVVSEGQDGAGAADSAGARPPVPRIDRIILYIDDLDRCPEAKVVDVLQAVHLLLAFPLFVVVVGVDSRWLLHSLRQHATVFRSSEDEDDGMDSEERVHWQSTPFNYLEKIFQIPFNLQPMEKTGFIALIDDLTIPKKGVPDEHGGPPVAAGQAAVAVIPADGTTTIVEPLVTAPTTATAGVRGTGSVPAAPAPGGVVQQFAVPPAAPAAPAAGTAPTQTAAPPAPPEPPSDPVEPNPPFLDLTEMERTFMHRMHRLIPTPRAAKRYVNVYRLLRASLPDSKRAVLEDDVQGGCRSVLLMLAILTGFPQEGTVILRELVEREPDGSWWKFIDQLARENMEPDRVAYADDIGRDKRSSKPPARRSGAMKTTADAASPTGDRAAADRKDERRNIEQRQRAQRWAELSERMVKVRADVVNEMGADPQCASFSRWARQVARYSFEAGRVVGVGDSDAGHERRPPTPRTGDAA